MSGNSKINAEANASDNKNGKDEKELPEKAGQWADFIFKTLIILIILSLVVGTLYLLITGQTSLLKIIPPFWGNLPEA